MIRPYLPTDRDQVMDVWLEASRVGHPFLDEAFLIRERREIAETHLPRANAWVWEEGGRVVGFIATRTEEVGGLFVHPAFHRRGIATALLDHVRSSQPTLQLSVFEANLGGRRFYEAAGFAAVGRRIHEASGQTEIRMRWSAGPAPSRAGYDAADADSDGAEPPSPEESEP